MTRKRKKIKIVIMKPTHRQGDWQWGKDKDGFQVTVPKKLAWKELPGGWREYIV